MTSELLPLGVKCNIKCTYCYQQVERASDEQINRYDLDRMKAGALQANSPMSLFGGEPLLVPKSDLEELFRWAHQVWGRSGVQTNGTLLDAEHVEMFKKYSVTVGFSIDGPGALNDARWAGSLRRTRAATRQTEQAIEQVLAAGLQASIIVTLHRLNAAPGVLPGLLEWLQRMDDAGVHAARLHLLEVNTQQVRSELAIEHPDLLEALRSLRELEKRFHRMRFDFFREIGDLLRGRSDNATCVWKSCDSLNTAAVQGIDGTGKQTNCGRVNKLGVGFAKADDSSYERSLALYATPKDYGGCSGCRFFLACRGYCPGTGIGRDWRNRSEHCPTLFALFEDEEVAIVREGSVPLSMRSDRRRMEERAIASWSTGKNPSLEQLVRG